MFFQVQNVYIQNQISSPEIQLGDQILNDSDKLEKEFQKIRFESKIIRIQISQAINIKSDNVYENIKQILKKFQKIEHLQIAIFKVYIETQQIKEFMDCFLESCPDIKQFTLKLNDSNLNKAKADQILQKIVEFQNIEVFNIECYNLNKTIPKSIGLNLQQMKNIQKLMFKTFDFEQSSSADLFEEISKIQTLKDINLNFGGCCLSNKGSKKLASMISGLKQLQTLHLCLKQCRLSSDNSEEIAKGISQCTTLTSLYLDINYNNLQSKFLFDLAVEIKNWSNLRQLSLFIPQIDQDLKTVDAVCEGLQQLKKIQKLSLYINLQNELYPYYTINKEKTFLEIKSFTKFMQSFSNLTKLDLQISQKSFVPILNQLKYCECIQDFSFGIDLSQESETVENFSQDQITKSLQNLENIEKIKFHFYNSQADLLNEMVCDSISSSLQSLHSTQTLCLQYQLQYSFSNRQLHVVESIRRFEQKSLDSLICLKDTLENIDLIFQSYNDCILDEQLYQLKTMKNLKTLKIKNLNFQKELINNFHKIKRLILFDNSFTS